MKLAFWHRSGSVVLVCLLSIVAIAQPSSEGVRSFAPGEPGDPANYDADANGLLDRGELKTFYLKEVASGADATDAKAEDFATDLLTSCEKCDPVPLARVRSSTRIIVQRRRAAKEAEAFHIGWPGLGFTRFVLDSVNPRPGKKFEGPLVFSYKRDTTASKHDQFTILGAIQLYQFGYDFEASGRSNLQVTPGADLDVDTSKSKNDNTISFGVPVYYTWMSAQRQLIDSLTLAVTPKFTTDRDFNREVVEGAIALTPTSPILQAGYIWPRAARDADGNLPWISLSWLPSFQLETGDVVNAGGNDKLKAQEKDGAYVRLTPRFDLSIYPWRLSDRITLQYQYFHRFDVTEDFNHYYGEARFLYDLTFNGLLQFTVVYRNGRKPPDFGQVNDVLIGLGLKQ